MSRSRHNLSRPESAGPFPEGGLFALLELWVAMLLVARLLEPPEGSVLGETLWITQLWFAGVVLWGWDAYRRSDFRLRLGWLDAALWVVIAGHGISTASVFWGGGDRRAALNLFWEWLGLGVSFFLLRQVLRSDEPAGRLVRVLLAAAVMLAAYGIWQHYIELPGIAADYQRLARELEQSPSPAEAARQQRELIEMGVPLNPSSRALWENRLLSSEPFATFALANTLAGFLAAWLFVAVDDFWFQVRRPGSFLSWRLLGRLLCLGVLTYCLILTKSRTAWAGALAGFFCWGAIRAGFGNFSRRWLLAVAGLLLVVFGFFAIAGLSGGFDRQVISEAPKSLAYRWQYWAGSWEVVKTHPWLGTGPGNFRQHYLHFKLPEASEEIADPHNWILDLWVSGGLLGLLGFVALLGLAGRLGDKAREENESRPSGASPGGISAWELGAGLAFLLVPVVRWLSGEMVEARPLWLLAGGGLAWGLLKGNGRLPIAGTLAGGLAMLVHLLGAGGIEMPAIVQTLLIFAAVLTATDWESPAEHPVRVREIRWGVMAVGGLAALVFVFCLVTATGPVWKRALYIAIGDATLIQGSNLDSAATWYEKAEQADTYSLEPPRRLGELWFQRWRKTGSKQDFQEAVRYGRLITEREPASHQGYRLLGSWYLERAKSLGSAADARTAAEYYSEAVKRYPNAVRLRAESAEALHRVGKAEAAAAEARKALELDQINREAGHIEKFLPEDLVERLNGMTEGSKAKGKGSGD